MRAIELRPSFVRDLMAVALDGADNRLSSEFLDDLFAIDDALQNLVSQVSDDQLERLSSQLERWRSQVKESLSQLICRVDDDDPLRCPISLFGTMDYGRLETAHTRVLGWLFDPQKEHGFGTTLIQALLRKVTGQTLSVDVYSVETERVIDGGSSTSGRLDVLVKGAWIEADGERTSWHLLIEAKIDADGNEQQLCTYEGWLDQQSSGAEVIRVFLTAKNRSCVSAKKEWIPLKFLELAQLFRTQSGVLRAAHGYHFLRFYIAGILRDVCGWPVRIDADCDNPYAVLSYVKHAIGS